MITVVVFFHTIVEKFRNATVVVVGENKIRLPEMADTPAASAGNPGAPPPASWHVSDDVVLPPIGLYPPVLVDDTT